MAISDDDASTDRPAASTQVRRQSITWSAAFPRPEHVVNAIWTIVLVLAVVVVLGVRVRHRLVGGRLTARLR